LQSFYFFRWKKAGINLKKANITCKEDGLTIRPVSLNVAQLNQLLKFWCMLFCRNSVALVELVKTSKNEGLP
jgi:hypothetical protein